MTSYDLDRELNDMAEQELKKDTPPPSTSTSAMTPRASTLPNVDDKNLAVVTHIATAATAAFTGGLFHLVVPAVAMVAFKDKSEFVRRHARNQLNFQLTYVAAIIAGIVLSVCTLGIGLIVAVPAIFFFFILDLVTSIRAALAASRGEEYEFPWSLQLFS